MEYFLSFILGSCFASFLVVVAQRVPQNMSLIKPASYCFNCQTPLRQQDLVPIIAYLRLKGRCFNCRQRFSALSFISELLLGSLFCYLTYLDVWERQSLSLLLLLLFAFILSLTDILYLIIEPRIFYPGMLLVAISLLDSTALLSFHLVSGSIIYFSLSLFNLGKNRLGLGDIKLLSCWALFLGFDGIVKIILVGSLVALIFSFLNYIWQKKSTTVKLPFVPFLSIGLLFYLLTEFWR